MNAPTPPPADIGTRIGQYVKLRDKIKEIKDRHKAELEPYNGALEQLEEIILAHLNQSGVDSVKGAAGTAYKTTKKSATLADADAFRRHVIGTEQWDLADWKANPKAVEAFIEENSCPPPGVNYTTIIEIGVRRS